MHRLAVGELAHLGHQVDIALHLFSSSPGHLTAAFFHSPASGRRTSSL
jgi:hypothetical protein